MTLNTALVAPMPRARDSTAVRANAGRLRNSAQRMANVCRQRFIEPRRAAFLRGLELWPGSGVAAEKDPPPFGDSG